MRLLITGSTGQLGTELLRRSVEHKVRAVACRDLDITDAGAVARCIDECRPDIVVNAGAYTAVDLSEKESEIAFSVNRDGAANLAAACARCEIPLIHISTDYVFDGTKHGAYVEDDPVAPLGVYGRSKAEGEAAVRAICSHHLILRTSWMFSVHGRNFVKAMLQRGFESEELSVVADQYGKPTAASELARLILRVLPDLDGCWGTYHVAQPEAISRYGFAETILAEAYKQGVKLKVKNVRPITTDAYPMPARRPANSELDCTKFEITFGMRLRPWRESLVEVIEGLKHGLVQV